MILRSHLIALNQVKVEILKTTNSLIVRVVSNVGLTVRTHALHAVFFIRDVGFWRLVFLPSAKAARAPGL